MVSRIARPNKAYKLTEPNSTNRQSRPKHRRINRTHSNAAPRLPNSQAPGQAYHLIPSRRARIDILVREDNLRADRINADDPITPSPNYDPLNSPIYAAHIIQANANALPLPPAGPTSDYPAALYIRRTNKDANLLTPTYHPRNSRRDIATAFHTIHGTDCPGLEPPPHPSDTPPKLPPLLRKQRQPRIPVRARPRNPLIKIRRSISNHRNPAPNTKTAPYPHIIQVQVYEQTHHKPNHPITHTQPHENPANNT